MSRIAGRNGAMYVAVTSGGLATPFAFMDHWTLSFATAKIDVTCMGDTNTIKVAGLPDATGSYSGQFDDATPQMYTAAVDGVARPMYMYPNRLNPATYWFGTAIFDASFDGTVAGSVTTSGNFEASSLFAKVG